ncbi:MAG: FliA/WhiG family RNA polymerase sigma factor [Chthoniobacteraceae bacterium]
MTAPAPHASRAARAYQGDTPDRLLVERHLPLVKHTVDRMRIFLPAVLDLDDLYSVGAAGLIAAARKFDAAQENTFPAFASLHIRGAVYDELRRMDWIPRSARDRAKQVQEKLAILEQRLGRPFTEEEACAELAVSAEEYASLLEEIRPATMMPLDGDCFSDDADQLALHEVIPDESQTPAREALEKKELIALLAEQLHKLPEMPKKVLALYYFENMRLSEIAAAFGLTEGRISQIHTQAVISLRGWLKRTLNPEVTTPC